MKDNTYRHSKSVITYALELVLLAMLPVIPPPITLAPALPMNPLRLLPLLPPPYLLAGAAACDDCCAAKLEVD